MSENNDSENVKQTQLNKKLVSGQTSKRSLENPVNVECTKKSKDINSILCDTRIDLSIKLKEIRRLTRKKLEELVLQAYSDVINNHSIIDELDRELKQRDQEMISLKKELEDVETQVQKLTYVQNSVSQKLQMLNRKNVSVSKIRRNVSVQPNMGKIKRTQSLRASTNSLVKVGLNNTIKTSDLTGKGTTYKTIPTTSTSTAGSKQMVVLYKFKNNNQQVYTNVIQSPKQTTPNTVNKPSTPKETQKPIVLPTVSDKHPAPLPISPTSQLEEFLNNPVSPILRLQIFLINGKVILAWGMLGKDLSLSEKIVNYQMYCYKETRDPPSTANWWKVDEFAALPLPMTYFLYKCGVGKYYFALCGTDAQSRVVAFSSPAPIIFRNAYNMQPVAKIG